MNRSTRITLEISGYLCEIVCGQIPESCREVFLRHLHQEPIHGSFSGQPFSVSMNTEEIKTLWYTRDTLMHEIMGTVGYEWHGFQQVDDFFHVAGFGSGKEGVGLFDIRVAVDDAPCLTLVPFEPGPDMGPGFQNMEGIPLYFLHPPPVPAALPGHVAISAGTWAKGTIRFECSTTGAFDMNALGLQVLDLENIGIGEDHLVVGVSYEGVKMSAQVIQKGTQEGYPVCWYDPKRGKWRGMGEQM